MEVEKEILHGEEVENPTAVEEDSTSLRLDVVGGEVEGGEVEEVEGEAEGSPAWLVVVGRAGRQGRLLLLRATWEKQPSLTWIMMWMMTLILDNTINLLGPKRVGPPPFMGVEEVPQLVFPGDTGLGLAEVIMGGKYRFNDCT
ncbi:ATPdependent RNA helicase [Branchiostoma belcheri]|nr:ATPdependent RNA helicase [Branchiostoma belcheri]